jgi:hypothetical protein
VSEAEIEQIVERLSGAIRDTMAQLAVKT